MMIVVLILPIARFIVILVETNAQHNGVCLNKSKAQASLEFLIVLSIFFSMLVVSFSILMNIKHAGDAGVKSSRLVMSINDIENSVNEVCALGEGTKKIVRLPVESANLDAVNEKELKLTYMGESGYAHVICKISSTPGEFSGAISVEKVSGEIVIEEA